MGWDGPAGILFAREKVATRDEVLAIYEFIAQGSDRLGGSEKPRRGRPGFIRGTIDLGGHSIVCSIIQQE
jgi:hypothetical protein